VIVLHVLILSCSQCLIWRIMLYYHTCTPLVYLFRLHFQNRRLFILLGDFKFGVSDSVYWINCTQNTGVDSGVEVTHYILPFIFFIQYTFALVYYTLSRWKQFHEALINYIWIWIWICDHARTHWCVLFTFRPEFRPSIMMLSGFRCGEVSGWDQVPELAWCYSVSVKLRQVYC
jgi:hypothetical protein